MGMSAVHSASPSVALVGPRPEVAGGLRCTAVALWVAQDLYPQVQARDHALLLPRELIYDAP
jgi:hypothetical protein